MTMTREERLAALEKQRRAAAKNGSAGRTTSTGRSVTNVREPRLKLPAEYTSAKTADPAIPPRTAKTPAAAKSTVGTAGTGKTASQGARKAGTSGTGRTASQASQRTSAAGNRQSSASTRTAVTLTEASAPKLSREERAEALNRRRAAAGAAGTAKTTRSTGTAKSGQSTGAAKSGQRNLQQTSADSESAAYEARRQKRRAEWEKRAKRARRRRIMFAAGIIAVLLVIAAVILWPKHEPAVFQESRPQVENQTPADHGNRVLPAESEDGNEENPEDEGQGEAPADSQAPNEDPQGGESQGEPQAEPAPEQPAEEQPPAQQAEVQVPIQAPAPGEQDLTAVQARLPEYVSIRHLPINPFSRPYLALKEVSNIVIHYVGNPGTTAEANRDYFESLASQSPDDPTAHHASSNFIIGLEGEIINCIPINEVAYCSNSANWYSISIEVCHPDEAGKFNDQTYNSLLHLTAWLCENLGLDETCLRRHFDITGKGCPKYYVDHPEAWEQLKSDVGAIIRQDRGL